MIEDREACARGQRSRDRLQHPGAVVARVGHRGGHHPGTGPAREECSGLRDRAVSVVGDEDLVARAQFERLQYGIHACGCVVDGDEIIRVASDEISHLCRGKPQQRGCRAWRTDESGALAQQEARGLPFHLVADGLLSRQDTARRGPDGAVVEVDNSRVQRPLGPHAMAKHWH